MCVDALSPASRQVAKSAGRRRDHARYRANLHGAKPLLAFARPPDRQTSWIATVLEETGIGFLSRDAEQLIPLNESARSSRLFA